MESQQWTSKLGFILAAAGSAIGLGAIWKFPYMAGIGGGGAFFLIFIGFTLLIGLPLLLAEFVIGRSAQKEAVEAYRTIAPKSRWPWVGKLGIVTCFILLSFYSVVGGWILLYLWNAITGRLWEGNGSYEATFGDIISNPFLAVGSQLLFILMTIFIVSKGVQNGVEKVNKYFMPALFVLFFVLIIRALTLDGAVEGVRFFLQPDFSNVTSEIILYAMGQSFFSLSVGVGVMVTYSSYLPKEESLPRSAFSIVGLTLVITLLAGLAIFPVVFAFGMEPSQGPGLLFIVLPAIFSKMAFGKVFFIIFLLLFFFATITSAISMLEISVASITAKGNGKREKMALIVGLLIFVVGIPSALSYGVLSDVTLFGKTVFDLADYTVSNILMPLGVLLVAIFVPFKMKKDVLMNELGVSKNKGYKLFVIWLFLLRYIAPLAIIIVFLNVIGLI
ncbi:MULTISPECIES: sodium-dependent transporter [unclassified Lysinibacillus]|uniref:sodium-dependent transporter n=1 Tax=unclassified Lysinibacillus TaxID=2636778 RepID=UPI002012DF55|nr:MULTISPECIES: sodium-dependent transporter [unclassified Lysinibacillus]MCL1694637.1 sodium-dependent transporter [Lysinibacillus sp. BPa_S21]MCL1699498.1 sodium-dependent transporter [Lysinibacillus sp. Bpr_S20]